MNEHPRDIKIKRNAFRCFAFLGAIIFIMGVSSELPASLFKFLYYIFPTMLFLVYIGILIGCFKNWFNILSTLLMLLCTTTIFCVNLLPLAIDHTHSYYRLIWMSIEDPTIVPNKPFILFVYAIMLLMFVIQACRFSKILKKNTYFS